jgi:hypothetical protein
MTAQILSFSAEVREAALDARAIRRHVREGGHEWALALQRANERMVSLAHATELRAPNNSGGNPPIAA